jgi:hypothetical protein
MMMQVTMLVQVMMQTMGDGSIHDNHYVDNPFSTPNIIYHTNVP